MSRVSLGGKPHLLGAKQVELTCNPLAVEPSRLQLLVERILSLHPLVAAGVAPVLLQFERGDYRR